MQRNLRLLRLGIAAELRNPGLRLLSVLGFLAGAAFAWNQGVLAGSAALVLTGWMGKIYGVAACLWFAYAAIRDQNEKAGAMLRSKPVDGAAWVLLLLLTGLGVWLTLLGIAFLGAALAQLPAAGFRSIASYGLGFLRAAPLVIAVGTLSFALSRMLRSPLGGIIIMFAWFCAMAGLSYIPAYLRPDYSQNLWLFAAAALLLLSVAGPGMERFRRGELRQPRDWSLPMIAVPALCLLTGFTAQGAYQSTPEQLAARSFTWDAMQLQDIQLGQKTPGFWLPDGRGGLARTAAHKGKILLIFLFPAQDLEAASTLPALEAITREYGERGVQPIGICLSEDQGDAAALVQSGGYPFPIGGDPTTSALTPEAKSTMVTAFRATSLPLMIVTDRQHNVRRIEQSMSYSADILRAYVDERLQAEPE